MFPCPCKGYLVNEFYSDFPKLGSPLPYDAERLDNGNTLVTDYNANTVTEYDSAGNVIWQMVGLHQPRDAERLLYQEPSTSTTTNDDSSTRPTGETVGGDVHTVNKITLWIPWIAPVVVIVAAGIYLVRRRVQG